MKVLAALLLLQFGIPTASIETSQRSQAAGLVSAQYYVMDIGLQRCVDNGVKDEAWRARTLGAWVDYNKPVLVAARTYVRKLVEEREAEGGKERRAEFEALLLDATKGSIEGLLDQAFAPSNLANACQVMEDAVAAGKLNLAAQLGDRTLDLLDATAPFVDATDTHYETMPFPVLK